MHRMLARVRLLEHKVAEFEQLVAALEANVHANASCTLSLRNRSIA